MSTQEVFRQFGPSSIEWLNNNSCNVVWLDSNTTARTLLGMSQAHYINKGPIIEEIKPCIDLKSHDNTAEPMEEDDYVEVISDSETGERVRISRRPCQELIDRCNTANRFLTDDTDMEIEKQEDSFEQQTIYEGLSFAKSEHLQLRYATKSDKKQAGGENKSWYYLRNGNPNYNGMKSILNNSIKKRLSGIKTIPTTRTSRKRRLETYIEEDKVMKREKPSPHGDGDAENLEQEVKLLTRAPSPKRVMRMYADDVEHQVKNVRKSAAVGLQVVIEPDHHTINHITGELMNTGIIRRIGKHHPLRAEGVKKVEHQNLFAGKLHNRIISKRLYSENISIEFSDEVY